MHATIAGVRRPVGPRTVLLPDIESVPAAFRGQPYVVRELLSDGDSNTKLRKSNAVAAATGYRTWGMSLAPADESGREMCGSRSAVCTKLCLFWQGLGRQDRTRAARIARTVAFFDHRRWFADRLRVELTHARLFAARAGLQAAVRPNVLSDVMWEKLFPWMFEEFPDVQFYDYTKHVRRMLRSLDPQGGFPANYHLTFSRSEDNTDDCLRVLRQGGNVAVVFLSPTDSWHGYPAVDGDQTDLRFLDPRGGVVIALSAKGTARSDTSGFVERGCP